MKTTFLSLVQTIGWSEKRIHDAAVTSDAHSVVRPGWSEVHHSHRLPQLSPGTFSRSVCSSISWAVTMANRAGIPPWAVCLDQGLVVELPTTHTEVIRFFFLKPGHIEGDARRWCCIALCFLRLICLRSRWCFETGHPGQYDPVSVLVCCLILCSSRSSGKVPRWLPAGRGPMQPGDPSSEPGNRLRYSNPGRQYGHGDWGVFVCPESIPAGVQPVRWCDDVPQHCTGNCALCAPCARWALQARYDNVFSSFNSQCVFEVFMGILWPCQQFKAWDRTKGGSLFCIRNKQWGFKRATKHDHVAQQSTA